MKELWDRACALMESEMNRIVYTTWIASNLTVIALEEDTLILRITMENMQRQLMNMHHARITDAVFFVCSQQHFIGDPGPKAVLGRHLRESGKAHAVIEVQGQHIVAVHLFVVGILAGNSILSCGQVIQFLPGNQAGVNALLQILADADFSVIPQENAVVHQLR